MRRIVWVIAALSLGGCLAPAKYSMGADGQGWGRKPVDGKVAPATLVARDGSVCRVSAERFGRVEVGDRVTCMWSAGR
jgi:hypothetical protein